MQTALLEMPAVDLSYQRAALKECIEYGEHGQDVETDDDGHPVCFNCGSRL